MATEIRNRLPASAELTLLGLIVRSPDAAQGVVFVVVFPMTFLASTFVPLAGLSPVLRSVASWNPISTLAAASGPS